MTPPRPFDFVSKPGRIRFLLPLAALAACAAPAHATGYYGPSNYLAEGGAGVTATPEFYWALETKRLARDFHPPEKRFIGTVPDAGEATDPPSIGLNAALSRLTGTIDNQDFADALKTGRIKPPDPAQATQQQTDARDALETVNDRTTGAPGGEFDSEFADYHRGARAYRQGAAHYDEARKAWEALLARPAEERHYRSVWAAFMLGKLALKEGNPDAAKWFQLTRQLAKDGFADSLGMAADSYGWEGRSEWKHGHPEKAAPLYLNQLALGDESAVVSLKALLPDRAPVDGMLNYGPEDAERTTVKAAAADPLLRRLVTAHILATATYAYADRSSGENTARGNGWLEAIKEAKPSDLKDAEYLGWVAYNDGDYADAARWLELAPADAPAALWLRAKLQLREGKLDAAAKSLAQAWQTLRDPAACSGGNPPAGDESGYQFMWLAEGWDFPQAASGDLAQLHLARNDFVQALDAFVKGELWGDAAFVAERVLTASELKAYVDQLPADPPPREADAPNPETSTSRLRYLLGRRLVREGRMTEAAAYLPPAYVRVLARYAQALQDAANQKLGKQERAKAWFSAAWLARYDGMELMGTEAYPDSFDTEGAFEELDLAKQRQSGKYLVTDYDGNGEARTLTKAMPLPPTKKEVRRLEKTTLHPDLRYHYRTIASSFALKAAALLKDNTEELADVLNAAGDWVKSSDEKTGFRIYRLIQARCPETDIGRASQEKDWFFDPPSGPWSSAEQSAYDALHQEAGQPNPQG